MNTNANLDSETESVTEHHRPNVLWICADQQRFDTLGCYGNEWVSTPNLDALASSGTVFENAFSQSPVCTPSRAAFLTGRYPRTVGSRQNGQHIPADTELVTARLKQLAGYTCGLAGKLHLSYVDQEVLTGTEKRINDGYDEFHWSHDPFPFWTTNQYTHFLTNRGAVYESKPYEGSDLVHAGMPSELHQTTWCADRSIDFIKDHAQTDTPWLFSMNTFDPHHPFDPPLEYLEHFADQLDDLPLPSYLPGELDNKPPFQRIDHEGPYGGKYSNFPAYSSLSDRDHRLLRAAYWAMVNHIDAQVGRVLAALDASGQRENTIVIMMSDHGEMLGDHGMYLKGPNFYDAALHVPLIMSQPGVIQAGQRVRDLVELVDIAPTLLEAANAGVSEAMQGRSLWPMLTGQSAATERHRDDVYCEYYNAMPWHTAPQANATMVRTETHKLSVFHGIDIGELYDLAADPLERRNLWDDRESQAIKVDMYKRLVDRMAWTTDPLPVREGRW